MMAVHPAPTPNAALRGSLSVLDGGRDRRRTAESRRDELHIEVLAFFAEVEHDAAVIVDAVTGLPVPSMVAINRANRLAYRASKAREEWVALSGPEDAA